MKIVLPLDVLCHLESWCATAGSKEVSGLGTLHLENGNIVVDRVYLLDAGSEGFTEIPGERIAKLLNAGAGDLKLWFHRHPVGNGIPGPQNWSGTDEATIMETPLGLTPAIVKWSVSIVRTPLGWVGRVDHYVKQKTEHLEVTQIVSLDEHTEILSALGRRAPRQTGPTGAAYGSWVDEVDWVNRHGTLPHDEIGKPATKAEKQAAVDEAVKILGHKIFKGKGWTLKQKLTHYDIEWVVYKDARTAIRMKMPPEQVAINTGIPLSVMRDLGLINWQEMEDAMLRAGTDDPEVL